MLLSTAEPRQYRFGDSYDLFAEFCRIRKPIGSLIRLTVICKTEKLVLFANPCPIDNSVQLSKFGSDDSRMNLLYQIIFKCGYRVALVWWWLRRPRTRGAYVSVVCDEEVLLVRHSYKPGWSAPAGGIKHGEQPIETACRELNEETGILTYPEQLRYVGQFCSRSEYKFDESDVFELVLSEKPHLRIDNREIVEARFVPRESVRDFPLTHITEQAWAST